MRVLPQYKIPQSVLVVVYTVALDVLLLRRTEPDDFWQSVTGSRASVHEDWAQTARRRWPKKPG